MKKLFLMSLVFFSTMLTAQKPVEIKLWPNGAPNTNNMTQQVENGPLYVAEPTLTVYPAKEGNGMAIVACPGGGYTHLAMNHEGSRSGKLVQQSGYHLCRTYLPHAKWK